MKAHYTIDLAAMSFISVSIHVPVEYAQEVNWLSGQERFPTLHTSLKLKATVLAVDCLAGEDVAGHGTCKFVDQQQLNNATIIKYDDLRRVSTTSYRTETFTAHNTVNYCCPGYSGTGGNCQREFS